MKIEIFKKTLISKGKNAVQMCNFNSTQYAHEVTPGFVRLTPNFAATLSATVAAASSRDLSYCGIKLGKKGSLVVVPNPFGER